VEHRHRQRVQAVGLKSSSLEGEGRQTGWEGSWSSARAVGGSGRFCRRRPGRALQAGSTTTPTASRFWSVGRGGNDRRVSNS
jgi:hypothetical protein